MPEQNIPSYQLDQKTADMIAAGNAARAEGGIGFAAEDIAGDRAGVVPTERPPVIESTVTQVLDNPEDNAEWLRLYGARRQKAAETAGDLTVSQQNANARRAVAKHKAERGAEKRRANS